jgi:acyl-CoA dehydrogenase
MVDFRLSPEQRAWRDAARAFAREHILSRADLDDHNHFPWDVYQAAFDAGLVTASLPKDVGGGGRPLIDLLLSAEELGYGDLGVATSIGLLTLAAAPLVHFGTSAQKARWLEPLTRELRLASFAWTEPEGSTNLFGRVATTTATPVDGGFELHGVKSTISNGSVASLYTVFARIEPGPPGLTCFAVPGDAQGLERRAPYRKMGQRASDTGEVVFHGVFVPADAQIGGVGQGHQIAVRSMTRSRTGICAMAVGVARRARDLVIEYGHDRRAGDGRLLIEHQDFRLRVAEMEAEIETARAIGWRAGWEVEHGREAIKLSSCAKLVGGNMAVRVTGEAVEMLGARGYLAAGKAEKLMRDAKVLQIYEGPQLVQKTLIADTATRRGRVGT